MTALPPESFRAVRLLLSELSDADLCDALEQVMEESLGREQRDSSVVRLFASSLPDADLDTLELEIRAELDGRELDRRLAAAHCGDLP